MKIDKEKSCQFDCYQLPVVVDNNFCFMDWYELLSQIIL